MLLSEDQMMVGVWAQRVKKKESIDSFFADATNDTASKRVQGRDVVVGFGRRNPNAQKGRERRGQKKEAGQSVTGVRRLTLR